MKFKYRRLRLVTGITTAESALAALERMREIRFHDPGAVIVVDEATGDAVPEAWLADAAAAARQSCEVGELPAHLMASAVATCPPATTGVPGAVLVAREQTEPRSAHPAGSSAQEVLERAQRVHARAKATIAATLDTLRVAGVAPGRIEEVERAMREIDLCFASAFATFAAIADSSSPALEPTRDPLARSLEPKRDPLARSLEPKRDPLPLERDAGGRAAGADESPRPAALARTRPRARTNQRAPTVATLLPLRARRVTAPAPVEPAASAAPEAQPRSRSTA